jgi:hypothetical protein
VKPRKRGIGRNPRTGKEVRIPPGGRSVQAGQDLQNTADTRRRPSARAWFSSPRPQTSRNPARGRLRPTSAARSYWLTRALPHVLTTAAGASMAVFMSDFGARRVAAGLESGIQGVVLVDPPRHPGRTSSAITSPAATTESVPRCRTSCRCRLESPAHSAP